MKCVVCPKASKELQLNKVIIIFLSFLLTSCTSSSVSSVHKSVEIDSKIEHFDFSKKFNNRKIEKRVKNLIAEVSNTTTAQKGCEELEAMGSKAVPYIIMNMDNYQKLPYSTISLQNKNPKAFEEYRHIRVKRVSDVLSEVLSQITGVVFSSKSNDEKTDIDRQKEVYLWRQWLYKKAKGSK